MIEFTPKFFACAAIIHGAVVAAAFAPPKERTAAMMCAAGLLAAWVLHLSSWTTYSPESAVTRLGMPMSHASAWAMMNTANAMIALAVARFTLWGPALFGLLFAACLNDTLYWMGFFQWAQFGAVADVIFYAEGAVFFVIGGPGIAAVVSRALGLGRRRPHSRLAAYREASEAP
jgi:hypothetical protein